MMVHSSMEDLRLPSPLAQQTSVGSSDGMFNETGLATPNEGSSISRNRTLSVPLDPEQEHQKTISRLLAKINSLEVQLNHYKLQNGEKPIEPFTPTSSPSIQQQSQSPTDRRHSSNSGSLSHKLPLSRPRKISASNFRASRTSRSLPSPTLDPDHPSVKDSGENSLFDDEGNAVQKRIDGEANRGIEVTL